jgi:hypothetical protein
VDKTRLDDILQRLHQAEQELEQELDRLLEQKREQFRYSLRRGRVVFEWNMRALQRRYKTGVWRYLREAPLLFILTAPVIYGMIIPLVLLDLSVTLYQQVCFRIYRIPRVRRRDYLNIDRHHLDYLNAIEKLNCVYCGYGNGVIEYAREVTARTEQYWCPIKHARRTLDEHARMQKFFDYGDAEAYRQKLALVRQDWSESDTEARQPR